jgi:DNA polymerase (family 10)
VYHGGVKNFEIARLFYEIAALLEARQESRFRIRAYQRAAQTVESLGEDVAAVAAHGGLQALPGIGKELAARVEEYLATGTMRHVEQLRGELPAAFPALLEVRGLGPKTARALCEQLGIASIDQLEEACRTGRVIGVAGVREKTRDNILKGIAAWRAGRTRTPLPVARAIAGQVVDALRAHGGVDRVEIAGSLRRGRETVKDIDILVTSRDPARVMTTFTSLPSIADVLGHGPTRATILHQEGLHVDLRVVEPEAFGAALQYFTGSKDHNVRVREIAVRKGLRLSEYGVFDEATGARIASATEEDVYAAVGLPWISPELRENGGEIDAARAGSLPSLVTSADLRGDLHAHTDWSDGRHPLDELIAAAEARGYEYIIVSDHSQSTAIANGLSVAQLRAQRTLIREIQPRFKIRILAGSECDILADGRMDFPDDVLAELDVVLAAVHSRFKQDRAAMTTRIVRALENPHVDILVHPTGRRIGTREPYDVDLDAVFATAKRHGKAVEINCSPERLDLPDVHARRAAEHGIPIAISTDAHGLSELDHVELGVTTARRAWIGPAQVLNTRGLDELLAWTRR